MSLVSWGLQKEGGGGGFSTHSMPLSLGTPTLLTIWWETAQDPNKHFILCHRGEIAQPKCDILRSWHLERGRSSNVNAIRTRRGNKNFPSHPAALRNVKITASEINAAAPDADTN